MFLEVVLEASLPLKDQSILCMLYMCSATLHNNKIIRLDQQALINFCLPVPIHCYLQIG